MIKRNESYLTWWIETSRKWILRVYSEDYNEYQGLPEGTIGDFGELLCYEIHNGHDGEHEGGLTFLWLAKKWNVSLEVLAELVADHIRRLDE